MMKDLCSVILPMFKAVPDFLEQSVQNILSQIYDEIELAVIFDKYNSNVDDSTFAVLEKFKDDHQLQLIVNDRRLGSPSSLNEGIRLPKENALQEWIVTMSVYPLRIEAVFYVKYAGES